MLTNQCLQGLLLKRSGSYFIITLNKSLSIIGYFIVSRTLNIRYNRSVDYRSVILVEEKSFFRCTA